MTIEQRTAMVERPVACSGKGQYIALVHYGSRGGRLYRRAFTYSHKDPRYRDFIVAISVVKRCLHPKSRTVPKVDRQPHIERVFSWVVEHDHSVKQYSPRAKRQHQEGDKVQPVVLPYTPHELALPVQHVVVTRYWGNTYASVGLRGVERRVGLEYLLAKS